MEIKKSNSVVVPVICALLIGAVIMYGLFYFFPTELSSTTQLLEKEVTVTDAGIADAVEKVMDGVVVVETYNGTKGISSGTGFVYKIEGEDAYIMTNHHVIDGGNNIYVNFTNDSKIKAEIVGSDDLADVAILTVAKSDVLAVVEIGSSIDLRVGDTVFAVGAPIDSAYSWTVTRGIVSGKDRLVPVSLEDNDVANWIMKVLQTDAAINSGNSGGPLSNSNGEVIGINTLKLGATGVEGMGFSIPIEDALSIAEVLETDKNVVRPVLGVTMWDYYKGYPNYNFELPANIPDSVNSGVIVDAVTPNSSAAKAGILKGDLIVEIEGEQVSSSALFRYVLYTKSVGDELTLRVYRAGNLMTIKVKL